MVQMKSLQAPHKKEHFYKAQNRAFALNYLPKCQTTLPLIAPAYVAQYKLNKNLFNFAPSRRHSGFNLAQNATFSLKDIKSYVNMPNGGHSE